MLGWLARISKMLFAWVRLRPIAAVRPGGASSQANAQHEEILPKRHPASPTVAAPPVLPRPPAAQLPIPQVTEDVVQVHVAAAFAKEPGGETVSIGGLADDGTQEDVGLPLAIGIAENVSVLDDDAVSSPSTVFDEFIEPAAVASILDTPVSNTELKTWRKMLVGPSVNDGEPASAAAPTPAGAQDISVPAAGAVDQMRVEQIVCDGVEGASHTDALLADGSSSETAQPVAKVAVEMPGEIVDGSSSCDPEFFPADDGLPSTRSDVSLASPAPYRPRLRQRSGDASLSARTATRRIREIGALDADLVVFFQPGGWGISISVLLRRGVGGPDEVNVRVDGDSVNVLAIDDTFFEPLHLSGVEGALRDGIAIETADTPPLRWSRTQRVLHVFSERPGISGFASVPRVVIGQENVILCTNEVGAEVLDFCRAADAEAPIEVAGPGVPSGWRCFRSYRPKRPAQELGIEEILLALNPKPDAAIELSGGISISRGTWITDRPPVIRLVGVQPTDGELTIDDQPASLADGGWVSSNWSALGRHVIRYAGLSRSYEIVEPEDHWDTWSAHPGLHFSACGAAVSTLSGARSIVLPAAGCWLLGAHPGQTAWAVPSVYGSAIAAPAFEPVWAILPRVGRTRTAPRLLASNAPPQQPAPRAAPAAVRQWRQLLRNGPPHLAAPEADALWQLYRHAARALKQRRRR